MYTVVSTINGSCCCRAAASCTNSDLQHMVLAALYICHVEASAGPDQQVSALNLLFAVADRARMLRTCTQGKLNLQLCLFIFTEQPQLLSVNTKQMAARIMTLADALGLPPADVAEVLIRCPALLDVLPLRCMALLPANKDSSPCPCIVSYTSDGQIMPSTQMAKCTTASACSCYSVFQQPECIGLLLLPPLAFEDPCVSSAPLLAMSLQP